MGGPALTSAQLKAKVGRAQRLISLTTYVQDGRRLYAAVWVHNTEPSTASGTGRRTRPSRSSGQKLEDLSRRLVSMDTFKEESTCCMPRRGWTPGTRSAKLWWWGAAQTADEIELDIPLYCSYMVEARTRPSTPDVFAHFRHGFPRPVYKESAALIALSGTAEVSDVKTDANGYFEQDSSLDLHLKASLRVRWTSTRRS